MQLTHKEIFKNVSVKNEIPLQNVQLVGSFIFEELNKKMKNPQSLILKIKSLGSFYLSRKKTNRFLEKTKREEPENIQLIKTLEERLIDYEKYVDKKKKVKEVRHENSKLIEPPIEEEDV